MPLRRLLTALGLRRGGPPRNAPQFLQRLQEQLRELGPERLEYLAGFAGQLARVAHIEGGISSAEAAVIAAKLHERAGLAAAEAGIVVELLQHEFDVLRSLQPYLLNRAVNAHASPEEKGGLIDCLYAVAVADHLVSEVEEQEIRRVANALLVPHSVLMEVRGRYRDRIEALRPVRSGRA
ncbi:MAG: TerB family tellurite resistance protein [Candidatus Binatia bacterium]